MWICPSGALEGGCQWGSTTRAPTRATPTHDELPNVGRADLAGALQSHDGCFRGVLAGRGRPEPQATTGQRGRPPSPGLRPGRRPRWSSQVLEGSDNSLSCTMATPCVIGLSDTIIGHPRRQGKPMSRAAGGGTGAARPVVASPPARHGRRAPRPGAPHPRGSSIPPAGAVGTRDLSGLPYSPNSRATLSPMTSRRSSSLRSW